MYIVVVLLCSFFVFHQPISGLFFLPKIPTFRVPTHISREHGVGRGSQEGRKEECKKTMVFYFFLLILIRERKQARESRICVSQGKGQKTREYSPPSELIILFGLQKLH
jgi:hypothetical protein